MGRPTRHLRYHLRYSAVVEKYHVTIVTEENGDNSKQFFLKVEIIIYTFLKLGVQACQAL